MKGITIALVSCLFLGLEPVFSKMLLNYIPPIVLAALASFASAFLLVFILEVGHKIREIEELGRRDIITLAVISLLSGVLAQLFYVTGLMNSTATNAVLLTRLNSLLIALMGVIFLREKFSLHQIVGSVIMVAGVVVIATKNFTVPVEPMQGDFLLILTSFCWATANIIMKKCLCSLPPEVIVIGRQGFAGVILLALAFNQLPGAVNPLVLTYMTGLVILVFVVGQYLWYYALEHTSACNVGLASLTIPLFGVIYAVTLLGERLTSYQIIGGALIVVGLIAIEIHLSTLEDIEHRIRTVHMPHH